MTNGEHILWSRQLLFLAIKLQQLQQKFVSELQKPFFHVVTVTFKIWPDSFILEFYMKFKIYAFQTWTKNNQLLVPV